MLGNRRGYGRERKSATPSTTSRHQPHVHEAGAAWELVINVGTRRRCCMRICLRVRSQRVWSSRSRRLRRGVSSTVNNTTPLRTSSPRIPYTNNSPIVRMVHTLSQEQEFLKTALKSKTESPVDAARTFTNQIRGVLAGEHKDTDLEDSLNTAWNSFIDVAADLPHESQQYLVEILCAIQKENLSDQYPTESIIWGEKVRVFEGLPLFGPAVRSAWNRSMLNESHILQVLAS